MNTRTVLTTTLTAMFFTFSGIAAAAPPSSDSSTSRRAEAPFMGAERHAHPYGQMQHMKQGGMMPGGMMGMMGGCPMVGPSDGPNGKVMMQMHGEMMRAMGDIMMKYADKFEVPSAAQ